MAEAIIDVKNYATSLSPQVSSVFDSLNECSN